MKLLIVEDAPNILEALYDALEGIVGKNEITACLSRDSAFEAIGSHVFDYAILDLKIPTVNEHLDAEVIHGEAVYRRLQRDCPGTPVLFLTAFATEDFLTNLLQEAERDDVWGSGKPAPMVSLLSKKRLGEITAIVKSVKDEISKTDDIEINAHPQLGHLEARVLRIFGRRNLAASLLINQLSGGLSGIQVLRVRIRDGLGNDRLVVAARLGNRNEIKDELERYSQEVIRLPNGTFSTYAGEVFAGAGPRAGVFYKLIANFETLADLLRRDPNQAAQVVSRIEAAERPWTENRPQSSHRVGEIRRFLVSDAEMNELREHLKGIAWEEFEQRQVQTKICCQHGDLHCGNVGVDANKDPTMIDFARVGEAPAALDPVTLELSTLFNPSSRIESDTWPLVAHAAHWDDIDAFVADCPIEQFIRSARDWSTRAAGGLRELYATAYALAVRQLKYADTDKELARAIISSAIAAFQRT